MNNRKHVRMPGNNKAAVIYPGGDETPIMCTVADISDGGAGLTVSSLKGIPERFQLEIKGEPMPRSCKVAWKKGPNRFGVSFE
jgi:PilZ domain